MWRRIHSDRNTKHTLAGELEREFNIYFQALGQGIRRFLERKPELIFRCMILLLAFSSILSFTYFRNQDKNVRTPPLSPVPVNESFDRLISTTGKLRETIRLKSIIDSISAKRQLRPSDSLQLNQALDRLSVLQKSLNHISYEH